MDLLTWLLMVFGFGFAICLLLLVEMIGDLSQASVHESPASAGEPGVKANESPGSSPTKLSGVP
jgi:hypothetical protein